MLKSITHKVPFHVFDLFSFLQLNTFKVVHNLDKIMASRVPCFSNMTCTIHRKEIEPNVCILSISGNPPWKGLNNFLSLY